MPVHVQQPLTSRNEEYNARKEEIGKCQASNYQSVIPKPSQPPIVKTCSQPIPKQNHATDRFISSRYEYNVDAANYLLTKKAVVQEKKNQLDVFTQVNSLTVTWRKKFMHQLMVKENIIPGVRQKQVLRGSQLTTENKLPGNLAGQPKDLWDEAYLEDGMWKSKPRNRPLIGIMDSILDLPGFQPIPRFRFHPIDWSSTNWIAAAFQNHVTFYDNRISQPTELSPLQDINACALKWNNAGDKLVMSTMSSDIKLYDIALQKIVWSTTCKCLITYHSHCFIRCICWSENDHYIVTGCKGVVSIYLAKTGALVNTLIGEATNILTLSFSSNYRYLVTSSSDTSVRIFHWATLAPVLDISYYEPVKAVAWHPHENGLLCIAGGLGDASLSLWNANKQDPLSYRRVQFHGAVDNLAWNKVSGELVVHWSYWKDRKRYTIMPIMASLDRIVDIVPVEKESRVTFVMWNADHTQLATHSDDSLSIWNFFGNEYQNRQNCRKSVKKVKTQEDTTNNIFTEFKHFNIR